MPILISILFYIFVTFVCFQTAYFLLVFSKIAFYKSQLKEPKSLKVSVIICAKNEAENLNKFLPSIINQDYRNFEIVLINDASTDDTLLVMEKFAADNTNIKIVNVKNNEAFWANKKYALTLGIKAAKNEHLLFTDADCLPASDYWVQEMSEQFSESRSIVLGYGKYKFVKNSLVNILVRYETLLTAIQYFSYAKLGSPYMAVGRNLAYTKSEFFRVKGFINHMNVRSGDDDLFIKDAATSTNTSISIDANSFTISEAPKSFREWFRQKRRHISTSSHYKTKHQFFLGLFYFSKILMLVLTPLVYFLTKDINVLFIILSYLLVNYVVVGLSAKKLKDTHILYFLPFLEIFLVLFQFAIFITNMFSKPTHWK